MPALHGLGPAGCIFWNSWDPRGVYFGTPGTRGVYILGLLGPAGCIYQSSGTKFRYHSSGTKFLEIHFFEIPGSFPEFSEGFRMVPEGSGGNNQNVSGTITSVIPGVFLEFSEGFRMVPEGFGGNKQNVFVLCFVFVF